MFGRDKDTHNALLSKLQPALALSPMVIIISSSLSFEKRDFEVAHSPWRFMAI